MSPRLPRSTIHRSHVVTIVRARGQHRPFDSFSEPEVQHLQTCRLVPCATYRDIFFLQIFSSFSFSADQIFSKYFSPFPRSVTTSSELEDNIVRLIPSHSFSSSDICKLLDLFRVPHIVIFFFSPLWH